MSVPYRSSAFEPHTACDADDFYESEFELSAGDRIGGPASRANDMLAWCAAIAIVVGGGWIMLHDDGALLARLPKLTAGVSDFIRQSAGTSTPSASPNEGVSAGAPYTAPAAEPPQDQATPPPLPVATSIPEPPAIKSEDPPATKSESADASTDDGTQDAAAPSAKQVSTPPRDPYQARAEAAGLNPGISHALLMRFSSTDFRNARVAIESAVAKTPDNGVFIWPRQRKPGEALFKVHFVEGAGPDCRRYVVSVTMNNWTTTALPMEKCGVPRVVSRTTEARDTRKRATP
ncbi:hypothetical protein HYPDE_27958 [Hyphomicrobium denitrificans 1NES1]|uniref:Uncharacterized protein n=1 Tax=Hyphomicrobium denitrificans 1NES1 TaxID=670307 RepID=N0B9Q1_9HYPH|nr:hypothetical protein [Hyphomicrobium denitrificans]AGK57271.1 hypothetical protein HYPDE_27958 [Hyphomicrobium denitrificans 1NES1]